MENAFLTAKYLFFYTRRDSVPPIPEDTPTYIDLTFCLEGEMKYTYNGKFVTLSAGDAIIYPVGSVRERFRSDTPNNYASFNVILAQPFSPEVCGYIPNCVTRDININA